MQVFIPRHFSASAGVEGTCDMDTQYSWSMSIEYTPIPCRRRSCTACTARRLRMPAPSDSGEAIGDSSSGYYTYDIDYNPEVDWQAARLSPPPDVHTAKPSPTPPTSFPPDYQPLSIKSDNAQDQSSLPASVWAMLSVAGLAMIIISFRLVVVLRLHRRRSERMRLMRAHQSSSTGATSEWIGHI